MHNVPVEIARAAPRLLIINNKPAFYRTAPFASLLGQFRDKTGGGGMVGYQVRRDLHSRGEWFHSPDDQLPFPVYFAAKEARSGNPWFSYRLGGLVSLYWRLRPTHIFAAGWDSPLSIGASAYSRLPDVRLGVWVESNPST